jgi:hypothetical protein
MWWYIVIFIVALFAAYKLQPKPQTRNILPEAIETPQAEEGREITVLFGTRVIDDPNIVWYGDLRTEAIKK